VQQGLDYSLTTIRPSGAWERVSKLGENLEKRRDRGGREYLTFASGMAKPHSIALELLDAAHPRRSDGKTCTGEFDSS